MPNNIEDYLRILPFIILGAGIFISILIEMYYSKSEEIMPWFTAIVLLASGFNSLSNLYNTGTVFGGMLATGGTAFIFNSLFTISASLVVLYSKDYIKKYGAYYGEYYILLMFSVLGMGLMAAARDLFMIFMGLELMSICFYVLAGINRNSYLANEASLKYFLLGSFATGFIVYGIALIYGATHTSRIETIIVNYATLQNNILFWAGILLLLVGFSFKISVFPFHQWVPDVYQGAPTSVSGLMATAGKSAAFGVLIATMGALANASDSFMFRPFFAIVSVLSMLYGSIVAISQTNIKRMLAYSSIAHAGYMSIGLAAGNITGFGGIVFYLIAYVFMNLGAFAIVSVIEGEGETNLLLEDFSGLSTNHSFLAAMMALFMFSLSGLPPFAGFFGKYYVFVSAIESGMPWLAIAGIISSVISAYFYLRIVVLMYFKDGGKPVDIYPSPNSYVAIAISALIVILLGIFPGFTIDTIALFLK